jgi:hypothetical protein
VADWCAARYPGVGRLGDGGGDVVRRLNRAWSGRRRRLGSGVMAAALARRDGDCRCS